MIAELMAVDPLKLSLRMLPHRHHTGEEFATAKVAAVIPPETAIVEVYPEPLVDEGFSSPGLTQM